ncbi:UDP-N-acetylglucosamine--N-acetylmuramyl-(pentapeptide) pyrophosphoryl-undecaprenol N-acetylglucosamine transferase [Nocardia sp. CA-129566]|uniref:UDP-N-acetylglucosamine--N-acetylmuramyl- (pentapeptide) pyrophosphoryl-undecaprenol N-acetylglucosamine transferase n=1 Tax=Nocardia sp. CA-129566 TaxID=3239976 RepID=UPI003D993022
MTDATSSGSARAVVRLTVAGGGTGGHVFPALTTIRTLRSQLSDSDTELEVLWVGQAGGLESRVAQADGIPFVAVATGKIRRDRNVLKMVSKANIADMCRVPVGVAQACRAVARFGPDAVLATGGYVAVPVGVASWLCRRRLVIHEQTVRLGLANRVLARVATRVAVSSESSLRHLPRSVRARAVVTGNPVRSEILEGGHADKAITALGLLGFDRSLPTVYITGGAQGAAQINLVVHEILPWLLMRANVIHQCGSSGIAELRRQSATLDRDLAARYLLTEFVGAELPDVLALADVAISRSGAGTIAELTALGKAAVLVPLASAAGNEQAHNARALDEAGAAVALLDEVSAETLREAVAPLLADPQRRAAVAAQARVCGRPDAAEQLANVLLSVAD